jgi:cephalosporin hydroxylase
LHRRFATDLIRQTDNFGDVKWLGHPIWQNVLDLWALQEAIAEIRPALLLETGTNRGGSALFYAHLFDLLDSDHSRAHVLAELRAYAPLVTPDSLILVQDGVIDVLPMFATTRPGPLKAIETFLAEDDRFEVDPRFDKRFLVTHHPSGWLRRRA